jgi:hypothetical protein
MRSELGLTIATSCTCPAVLPRSAPRLNIVNITQVLPTTSAMESLLWGSTIWQSKLPRFREQAAYYRNNLAASRFEVGCWGEYQRQGRLRAATTQDCDTAMGLPTVPHMAMLCRQPAGLWWTPHQLVRRHGLVWLHGLSSVLCTVWAHPCV